MGRKGGVGVRGGVDSHLSREDVGRCADSRPRICLFVFILKTHHLSRVGMMGNQQEL